MATIAEPILSCYCTNFIYFILFFVIPFVQIKKLQKKRSLKSLLVDHLNRYIHSVIDYLTTIKDEKRIRTIIKINIIYFFNKFKVSYIIKEKEKNPQSSQLKN